MNPTKLLPPGLIVAVFCAAPTVCAQIPVELTLSDLVQVYDGSPKQPSVVTNPPEIPVDWSFADSAAAPSGEVVYSNFPDSLEPSYSSLSFSAQKTWAVGDYIALAGSERNLLSLEVVLVTWAPAAKYPSLAAANPESWSHPITLSVYSRGSGGKLLFVDRETAEVQIPWRPTHKANGDPYLFNGAAFIATVPFPDGLSLPENPVFVVSYNTQNTGSDPMGASGPYNELNVAMHFAPPSIGTNDDIFSLLWVRKNSWSYPTQTFQLPMFRATAGDGSAPSMTAPPVEVGNYQATATVNADGYIGSTTQNFTIKPVDTEISVADLVQQANGSPLPISVTTTPSGLGFEILYDGSPTPPSKPGSYQIQIRILDRNHVGQTTARFIIGTKFAAWIAAWVDSNDIPALLAEIRGDPDGDQRVNLLEYALGLDPSALDVSSVGKSLNPYAAKTANTLSLVYRRNRLATDIIYTAVASSTPNDPDSWLPVITTDTLLSTDGAVDLIQATLPGNLDAPRRFMRLMITQAE